MRDRKGVQICRAALLGIAMPSRVTRKAETDMNIQFPTQSSLPIYSGAAAAGRSNAPLGAAAPPAAAAASLAKLAELIQRLWLFPGDMASNHKSYRALMDWMIAGAPSAAVKAELLSVVGHVNRRDYLQALNALRAITI